MINKLVIIGVGLIGGSLALALRGAGLVGEVVGVGRTRENLDAALKAGVVDQIGDDAAQAVHGADLVVLAVPVGQMGAVMSAIAPCLSSDVVVTDVGSTKENVVALAQRHLGSHCARFVPGHPIAGAETSGAGAARAGLFCDRNVVLTPQEGVDSTAVDQVEHWWRACGAQVSRMTPQQHDALFAAVSHLPHVLAFALVDYLAAQANADELFEFAASGFRDFTRIAASSPEMWRDICLANRTALLTQIDGYQQEIEQIRALLAQADAPGLEQLFARAATARRNWSLK